MLIVAVGAGGYYISKGRQHSKTKANAVVELSPDEFEVAPQPSPNGPVNVERRSKPRIVAPQQTPARSLPTGTRIIADRATTGDGQLEAINGTPSDACVMVVDPRTQRRVREISVQAESSFLLEHLDARDYEIVFATGKDWDSQAERFTRDASYFEFGKTLEFRQDATTYQRQTITLNAVRDGNVPRRSITEAEFHALSGQR
jgi:hypothetical protein